MNVCADVLTLQEVEPHIYTGIRSLLVREKGWEISEKDSNAVWQLSDLLWTVWTVFFLLPRTVSSWVGGITVTFGGEYGHRSRYLSELCEIINFVKRSKASWLFELHSSHEQYSSYCLEQYLLEWEESLLQIFIKFGTVMHVGPRAWRKFQLFNFR